MVLSIQVITVIRVGAPTEEIINRVIDIILIPEQIGTRIQTTRILSNGVTDASTRKNEAVTIKVKQSSLMMNSLHAFFLLLFEKKTSFSSITRSSLCSLLRSAYAQTVIFETLYGGQFTISTQLIILNYPVILSHRRSTTVSLETYPFCSFVSSLS